MSKWKTVHIKLPEFIMALETGQKRLSFSIESILSEKNSSKVYRPNCSPYDIKDTPVRIPCYGTESFEDHMETYEHGKKFAA